MIDIGNEGIISPNEQMRSTFSELIDIKSSKIWANAKFPNPNRRSNAFISKESSRIVANNYKVLLMCFIYA